MFGLLNGLFGRIETRTSSTFQLSFTIIYMQNIYIKIFVLVEKGLGFGERVSEKRFVKKYSNFVILFFFSFFSTLLNIDTPQPDFAPHVLWIDQKNVTEPIFEAEMVRIKYSNFTIIEVQLWSNWLKSRLKIYKYQAIYYYICQYIIN